MVTPAENLEILAVIPYNDSDMISLTTVDIMSYREHS
jgi:hypothetical protein